MTINKEQPVSDAMIEAAIAALEASGPEIYESDKAYFGGVYLAMKAASHPLEQQQAVSGDVVEHFMASIREVAGGGLIGGGLVFSYDQVEKGVRAALTASGVERMREALEAVEGAMLRGGDGAIGDFGWNVTKLNKARPLIRTALHRNQELGS